jgi:hypothetical protein
MSANATPTATTSATGAANCDADDRRSTTPAEMATNGDVDRDDLDANCSA